MSKASLLKTITDGVDGNLNDFFLSVSNFYTEKDDDLGDYNDERFSDFKGIGEINFEDGQKLVVVTANTTRDLTERGGKKNQYEKAKKILKYYTRYDAGIFVYNDINNNFRLSLVYGTPDATRTIWSNFRRFTYYASPGLTNKTFLDRVGNCSFANLGVIKDAFSVEKVTEGFYQKIADWYFWAVQNSMFPVDAEQELNGRNNAVIRLITRLIFIWFMKERELVPLDLFKQEKIVTLLKSLIPDETTYYKAILQNLFFATLNTRIQDRAFRFKPSYRGKNNDYMDHGIYRYEDYFNNREDMLVVFKDIPFLNGGLFDCFDWSAKESGTGAEVRFDGFSDKDVGLDIPNYLFFGSEYIADLNDEYGTKNKIYHVEGIINILSTYNFTIDENDPNDAEVALDPELLGKVFENLLASFNPETATTARKATGSYYTPREIVDYMVTQSLKQYYKTHLDDIEGINSKLDDILVPATGEATNPFNERQSERIVQLTEGLRIVDPAVGSGAFPMGILNKLVSVLDKVDHNNSLWQQAQLRVIDNIPDPVSRQRAKEQITLQFSLKNSNYGRKLYLIQRCIYGVDIQPIAIEIAKLRFFIALLVDETIDKSKPNWGIEPLPNMDFKLMQGNSLISEFMEINLDNDDPESYGKLIKDETDELVSEFQKKKNDFQIEPDRTRKADLKHEIEALILRIFESKLQTQKADYFGNLQKIRQKYEQLLGKPQYKGACDQEIAAIDKKYGFSLVQAEKDLKEFSTGQKVKPFFAWRLYFAEIFHEKNGFDIVIGNPPYIQLQKDAGKLANLYQSCGYQTFERTGDIYNLFYERGISLLQDGGHLCYITSSKWMRAEYGIKLRSYFISKNPITLIELGPGIFKNATVDTNILILQNASNQNNTMGIALTEEAKNEEIAGFINRHLARLPKLSTSSWFIGSETEQRLKEKIQEAGKPLDEWKLCMYRGILTGLNEAFIVNSAIKERLCREDPKSEEILKPLLRGRDIRRYGSQWANLWLIASGYDIDVPKLYPAVYRYMKQWEDKAQKRGDQGQNWWNLRACVYYPEFKKEKIAWIDLADQGRFALVKPGIYLDKTLFFITGANLEYLLGILNSKLINWYFDTICSSSGVGTNRWAKTTIGTLPIPEIGNKTSNELVVQVKLLISSDKLANAPEIEKRIDQLVYQLYDLTSEEIAVVEGNAIKGNNSNAVTTPDISPSEEVALDDPEENIEEVAQVEIILIKDKETPGTWRYKEEKEDHPLTIYLTKEQVQELGNPKSIKIAVTAA